METVVGSLLQIPLENDAVDAVWIANVLMYIEDNDLPTALSEAQRVTRPGGLIAAKESDQHLLAFTPIPTERMREVRPPAPVPPRIPGVFRSRENIHHVRTAGIREVRQWTVRNEQHAPMSDTARAFAASALQGMSRARLASDPYLSPAARAWLEDQLDPASDWALVNHPRFSFCEAHVVTVGRVAMA